jgi:Tfp pilus assembly protein PilX
MSTAMIIVTAAAAVVVVGAVTIWTLALARRRELQQRFGTEYDRVVRDSGSTLRAEAGLRERERRVRNLDIRPLTISARESYADQWAAVQEQFVDAPADAVAASHVLVIAVMNERGYPADHPDQVLADLSVEHASALDRYRSAEQISGSVSSGTASTEDLRRAMIGYHALFRDLLGQPDGQPGSPAAAAALTSGPDDVEPVLGGTAEGPSDAGELADGPSHAPRAIS